MAVKEERQDWMMDKQKKGYDHASMMSFALKMFNNKMSLGEWKLKEVSKKKPNKDPKYFALST
eukprot:10461972-Ditylum_brightwellii.AAC.1